MSAPSFVIELNDFFYEKSVVVSRGTFVNERNVFLNGE